MVCALLTACAGGSRHGDLRFVDTETVGKARHAAYVAEQASARAATQAMASPMVRAIPPAVLALMQQDHDADELEKQLAACAVQAEQLGNARYFENRPPTRQECAEVVEQDRCGKPVTRAMQLGKQKHVLALQCAEAVLKELWPAPFSIEQRYRYYPNARFLETISRAKEAQLIADGCTEELRGTIKPDLVLHGDRNLLKSALTLDFKFPCPDSNEPQWTRYGRNSPYANQTQQEVYEQALGGRALLVSPQKGVRTSGP
ncbi:putative lipoprotein [Corallococcus coralloides]|uniref:Putative lipoprotein n=1 Tax=Corallococcus coralloides TaxID=184914 RepID=A0A410S337_CORCK|nr:putative lipoprotein [Corallococcus coralloides]